MLQAAAQGVGHHYNYSWHLLLAISKVGSQNNRHEAYF